MSKRTVLSWLRGLRGPMSPIGPMRPISPMSLSLIGLMAFTLSSCDPEPPLHLYDSVDADFDLPLVDLDLEVYWDYQMDYEIGTSVTYDWHTEWNYDWDETDLAIFGELGYAEPKVFNLRRYYTGDVPYGPHTTVSAHTLYSTRFNGRFDWGFWDILVWNEITTLDGVQSLHIDEEASLEQVVAYTNPSMTPSRYQAPRYTSSFYEPEALFTAYEEGIEINRDLRGFDYDAERNVYIRHLNMRLMPITYIYLTQVILRHNNGRITAVDGNANLSGMARSTVLNTGLSGEDAITVYYNVRMKKDMPITHPIRGVPAGERTDIVGGRLMSFGLCNTAANSISRANEVSDPYRHYMDVTMQFNNGMDSTFVFDVTDQVRERYKGGVLTVVLDMDTVPIPQRKGGSGFDAVVKDFEDGGTHEFEM